MFQFRRFPSYAYLIQRRMTGYCPAGLPHSEISGSTDICSSPKLIAACHVLRRLLMPRHSPCALSSLTCGLTSYAWGAAASSLSAFVDVFPRSAAPPSSAFKRFAGLKAEFGDAVCLFCRVREFLVLFENYAGFTKIRNCMSPCILSDAVPQSILLPLCLHRETSLLPYLLCHIVQFSRCRVRSFRNALPTAFAVRFEDPTLPGQVFKSKGKSPGGPEWARTTDLTIISRTL